MKVMTTLNGCAAEAEDSPRARGSTAVLHHEVADGVFLHVELGPAGLAIFREGGKVLFPLDRLVELAVMAEPLLAK